MNARVHRLLIVLPVAAIAAAALLGGCQSKKDKARDTMLSQAGTFSEKLQKMPAEIDEVSKKMLKAASGQNPTRADDYREFNKSLTKLREQATLVGREADIAQVDSAKYFSEWAKQARKAKSTDKAGVREAAAASKAQVDAAQSLLAKGREGFRNLMTSFDNVDKRLATDLSEKSIMAAQTDVQNALSQSLDVRNYIDRLNESIDAALGAK